MQENKKGMIITSLIDNISTNGLGEEHGLSLYIQLDSGKSVLFDMGQCSMFANNAKTLGIDLTATDIAVISHGHYDHGGGLEHFMLINKKANIYIHQNAFEPHYSKRQEGMRYIGLMTKCKDSDRLLYCDNVTHIGESITLFSRAEGNCCKPNGNILLYGPDENTNDSFVHEQSMLIKEGSELILIAGCAHTGIINIMRRAEEVAGQQPTKVFAGMHLVKSGLSENDDNEFISLLARHLLEYKDCTYYTMHCTGWEQYNKLRNIMGEKINYMASGQSWQSNK